MIVRKKGQVEKGTQGNKISGETGVKHNMIHVDSAHRLTRFLCRSKCGEFSCGVMC